MYFLHRYTGRNVTAGLMGQCHGLSICKTAFCKASLKSSREGIQPYCVLFLLKESVELSKLNYFEISLNILCLEFRGPSGRNVILTTSSITVARCRHCFLFCILHLDKFLTSTLLLTATVIEILQYLTM